MFGLLIVVEFNSWFFFFLNFEKYNHFKLDTRISKGLYSRWQGAHDGHRTSGDNWIQVLLDDGCVNYIKYPKDRSIRWIYTCECHSISNTCKVSDWIFFNVFLSIKLNHYLHFCWKTYLYPWLGYFNFAPLQSVFKRKRGKERKKEGNHLYGLK